MSPIVGIRANAGSSIGFGHVRRCLSLAEALLSRGAKVVFLVNPESAPEQWMPQGPAAAVETVSAIEAATLIATNEHIGNRGIRALVVDSYESGAAAFGTVKVPVAAIVDAPPPAPLPVSLLINGAADAPAHQHPLAPGSRALLGPDYILLQRAFEAVPSRQVKNQVEGVLVTTGGGDERGLSLLLAAAARRAMPSARIVVVAGRYFPPGLVDALEQLSISDPALDLVRSPPTLHTLMLNADLALTTGGQTTYELAATGTPACAVRLAANQTGNLAGLSAAGTLDWVGDVGEAGLEARLEGFLRRLAADTPRREKMSCAGQTAVDGQGSARVAKAVLELCA